MKKVTIACEKHCFKAKVRKYPNRKEVIFVSADKVPKPIRGEYTFVMFRVKDIAHDTVHNAYIVHCKVVI